MEQYNDQQPDGQQPNDQLFSILHDIQRIICTENHNGEQFIDFTYGFIKFLDNLANCLGLEVTITKKIGEFGSTLYDIDDVLDVLGKIMNNVRGVELPEKGSIIDEGELFRRNLIIRYVTN